MEKKKKIPKTTNQQPIDHDKDGMQIIRKKKINIDIGIITL